METGSDMADGGQSGSRVLGRNPQRHDKLLTSNHIKCNIANILVFLWHGLGPMFAPSDHFLHAEGEALPHDFDVQTARGRCLAVQPALRP